MADPQAAPAAGPDAPTVQFGIDRIYSKDLSLENPGAPGGFQGAEPPQVEIGLRTRTDQVQPDVYESVLTVTVTAKSGDKTLFLVAVAQAGPFTIRGVPAEHMQPVIAIHCPTVLFPYAREAIAHATMNAGYPPVQLAPINFEALYAQQLAQMQAQPAATAVQ
jgi:preprotein translocase subunit SecB